MGTRFEEIISFAIAEEKGAAALYTRLSGTVEKPGAKVMFDELTAEEVKHKEFFEGIKKGSTPNFPLEEVTDLKISDYLVEIPFKPDMEYQDILIMAIKKEGNAIKFYKDIAAEVQDSELQKLLKFIVQEEAKHKLRLEAEYDDIVLAQN